MSGAGLTSQQVPEGCELVALKSGPFGWRYAVEQSAALLRAIDKNGGELATGGEQYPNALNVHDMAQRLDALVTSPASTAQMAQQPPATVPTNSQDWAGMDGTTVWHLIERHADNWTDVGKMMGEWLAANQAPASTGKVEAADRHYEELRSIIDGGSESMTHKDAVEELKAMVEFWQRAPGTHPTPPTSAAAPPDWRTFIEGMSVSVDVSTCDEDAGYRYFGTVTEAMEHQDGKHGVMLLVQDAEPNFDRATGAAAPAEQLVPIGEDLAIRMWHESKEAHTRHSAFEWFAAGIIAADRYRGAIAAAPTYHRV